MRTVEPARDARGRHSQLDYAVLSLVIERPSYGYEISERFGRRFGELAPASQSGVYKALQRLREKGLIERARMETDTAPEGRPRIHYRATGMGAATYRAWLAERIRDVPDRSGILSRLASTGMRSVEVMLEVLARYERECVAESETGPPVNTGADALSLLIGDLIAEERSHVLDGQLRWIAYARKRIRVYEEERS